jgi:hypothetical protein
MWKQASSWIGFTDSKKYGRKIINAQPMIASYREGTDLPNHRCGLLRGQRDDSTCPNNGAVARIADDSAGSSGF